MKAHACLLVVLMLVITSGVLAQEDKGNGDVEMNLGLGNRSFGVGYAYKTRKSEKGITFIDVVGSIEFINYSAGKVRETSFATSSIEASFTSLDVGVQRFFTVTDTIFKSRQGLVLGGTVGLIQIPGSYWRPSLTGSFGFVFGFNHYRGKAPKYIKGQGLLGPVLTIRYIFSKSVKMEGVEVRPGLNAFISLRMLL